MNINPFIELIAGLLQLYNFVLIAWVILSVLINFEIINRFNPFVQKVQYFLNRMVEPVLAPIRRVMRRFFGDMGGIDLSPIILILLLEFVKSALYTYFYTYPTL